MREMTTKEVQRMSLDILQDFHDFCVKNNLHYSLSGGTLLGAIRHNGFIPWDDDIDVQMPRPDYDRFIHTYISDKGYKVYSRELSEFIDKQMAYPYARICDINKTFVDVGIRPWIKECVGLWIDILPCDGITSNKEDACVFLRHLGKVTRKVWRSAVRFSPWSDMMKGINIREKFMFFAKKVYTVFWGGNPYVEWEKLRRKYDYTTSDYFFATPHYGMGEWQPKKNMESFELHKFEGSEFYIMSGWDANLKSLYGDYMKLPPENKRISHDFNRYYWKD